MVHTILKTEWILDVADIAADLKRRLASAKDRSQRTNALRDSDIRLQRADQEYATRAGSNIPSRVAGASATLIDLRSLRFDFPVLEYRPFRTFSLTQSSSLVVQLYGGFEVPLNVSVVQPIGAPEPNLKTVWEIGLRLVFDWRYYL
jgi:hypothetical protein